MSMIKTFLLGIVILTGGCAGWRTNTSRTLDYVHEAGVAARKIGNPIFDELCKSKAVACKAANDTACPELFKCHDKLDKFTTVLKAMQFLVIDGKIAVALDDEPSADNIISRVLQILAEIHVQLAELGVTLK